MEVQRFHIYYDRILQFRYLLTFLEKIYTFRMDKNCLYFQKETIATYLVEKKKAGTLNLKSKDYELVVALLLRELYEKRLEFKDAIVGLPLRDDHAKDFPNHDFFEVSELERILERKEVFDEDSDVDVVIGRKIDGKIDTQAAPYQLKRFGLGKEAGGGTRELIDFLKKYEKYSPTKTRLMILIEVGTKTLETKELVDWLKDAKYPFKEVIIVVIANDVVTFAQLFPNPGVEEFPLAELGL